MKNRWDILIDLINKIQAKNIVEIGVSVGKNATEIIQKCKLNNFYLVDPDPHGVFNYGFFCNYPEAKFLRLRSIQASKCIEDNSLDIVYIDGQHNYESVIEDIMYWTPKIRAGGIICGHDYIVGYPVEEALKKIYADRLNEINLEEDVLENGLIKVWWKYV